MADRVLREPCEHGRYEGHLVHDYDKGHWSCPGGRKVTDAELMKLAWENADLAAGLEALAPYVSAATLKDIGGSGAFIVVQAALGGSDG